MPRNLRAALSGLIGGAVIVVILCGFVAGGAGIEGSVGDAQGQSLAAGSLHVELLGESDEACVLCHEQVVRGAVAHEPAAAGLCITCHLFTGTGDQTRVSLAAGTASDTTPLCTGCHADIGEQLTRATVHAPAAAACVLCHSPHGSPNVALLLEPVNTLCLGCHRARTPASPDGDPLTLFGRPVSPAEQAALSGPLVTVDPVRNVGHPVAGHPVSGPEDPVVPGRPFTCISCHVAHGSDTPRLKRFGEGNPTEFCVRCH